MPGVDRSKIILECVSESYKEHGFINKILLVVNTVMMMFLYVFPYQLAVALKLRQDNPNVGRLKEVIKNQIWQQSYCHGGTNSTIFQNRKGTGLLLYAPPRMTPEFQQDIANLKIPIEYILLPDISHESFGNDAKKAYPNATMICPASAKEQMQDGIPDIDKTIEDVWEDLQNNYGFVKVFKFDDCCRYGASRSYQVEKFQDDENDTSSFKKNILFVGQCGFANAPNSILLYILGFSKPNGGRYFRQVWYAMTKNPSQVKPFWTNMVSSIPNLEMALFLHGPPAQEATPEKTKEKLLFDWYIPE